MTYTNRTCHKCGYRDIQPNMVQETIKVASGQSKAGAGANTWAAAMLGDKSATKAVNKAIWGTGTRNYTRNKQVWSCGNGVGCAKKVRTSFGSKVGSFLIQTIFVLAVFYFIAMISS